jgi:hypothetical protein
MPPPVNSPVLGLVLPTGSTFQTEMRARDALEGRSKGLRAFLPFFGPAIIASVGYMDPGISLFFLVSLLCGLSVTGLVTFAILQLDRRGFRPLALLIAGLVGGIGSSYLCELIIMPPNCRVHVARRGIVALDSESHPPLRVRFDGSGQQHDLPANMSLTEQREGSSHVI